MWQRVESAVSSTEEEGMLQTAMPTKPQSSWDFYCHMMIKQTKIQLSRQKYWNIIQCSRTTTKKCRIHFKKSFYSNTDRTRQLFNPKEIPSLPYIQILIWHPNQLEKKNRNKKNHQAEMRTNRSQSDKGKLDKFSTLKDARIPVVPLNRLWKN